MYNSPFVERATIALSPENDAVDQAAFSPLPPTNIVNYTQYRISTGQILRPLNPSDEGHHFEQGTKQQLLQYGAVFIQKLH